MASITIDASKFEKDIEKYNRNVLKDFTKKVALYAEREMRLASESTKRHKGEYRKGWMFKIDEGSNRNVIHLYSDVAFAKFVHDGTRAHIIRPKHAKFLRFEVDGEVVFAKKVHHPGYEGRHDWQKITPKIVSNADRLFESVISKY